MSSLFDPLLGRRRSRLYLERTEQWRRPPGELPRVIGHRGSGAPENTLVAFDRALAEGAWGIELDVRMTRDGALIVAHDPDWTTGAAPQADGPGAPDGAPRKFGDLSLDEVRGTRLTAGERIPTLQEVLDWQRDTGAWLNVELKGDVPSQRHVVRATCSLLRSRGADRILLSGFYPLMLAGCARLLPDVPSAWLVHSEQRLLRSAPGWRWSGAAGVHPEASGLSEARLRELLEQGALVNMWTVNDPDRAVRLAALGVDGLITDSPGPLLAALAQSEQRDCRTTTPGGGL